MPQVADPRYVDVIAELLSSFDGWRSFDAEQVLRFGWIEAPEDQVVDYTLTRFDIDDAKGTYQHLPGGEPPREIEIEWGHVSHPEQPGELAAAVEADRGLWADPSRTVKRPVPGAAEIYLLSPKEPYRIEARWSTEAGAIVEVQRIRDRVARREGFRVTLGGDAWLYHAIAPGDYLSVSHPRAPGGTVTAIVWQIRRILATSSIEVVAWGVLSE